MIENGERFFEKRILLFFIFAFYTSQMLDVSEVRAANIELIAYDQLTDTTTHQLIEKLESTAAIRAC